MDYGPILRRAWSIIWKFKVLWIFGILASCSGNASPNLNFSYSGRNNTTGQNNIPFPFPQIEQYFRSLDRGTITLMIVIGVIIALVLLILATLLGTVGRVGLIRGTMKAEQGAERLTFGELWRDGLAYFWRIFGLNLLIGLIIFVALLIIFIPAVLLTVASQGVLALCFIPFLCVLVPVFWAVTLITEQANIALVVENLSITDALRRGWQVVRENLGPMVVMSLILFVIGLIAGVIIGIPFLIVIAPVIAGYISNTGHAIQSGWIGTIVLFILYLPILLLLNGILRAFTSSAWTLTYLRLTTPPAWAAREPLPPPAPPAEPWTPPVQNP